MAATRVNFVKMTKYFHDPKLEAITQSLCLHSQSVFLFKVHTVSQCKEWRCIQFEFFSLQNTIISASNSTWCSLLGKLYYFSIVRRIIMRAHILFHCSVCWSSSAVVYAQRAFMLGRRRSTSSINLSFTWK